MRLHRVQHHLAALRGQLIIQTPDDCRHWETAMNRLLFVVLAVSLIGCGASPATSPPPTPTKPPLASLSPSPFTPRSTETPVTTAGPPTALIPVSSPPVAGCGTVELRSGHLADEAAARNAIECFWLAYQRCATGRDTQLVVTLVGGAEISQSVYTLAQAGTSCSIQFMSGIRPSDPQSTAGGGTARGQCMSAAYDQSGVLHLTGCTFGNIDIPPP